MSGNLVGSLPMGIQTHFNRDVPYWPAENCYNWKEVWVHPSARWLGILAELEPQPGLQAFLLLGPAEPIGTFGEARSVQGVRSPRY